MNSATCLHMLVSRPSSPPSMLLIFFSRLSSCLSLSFTAASKASFSATNGAAIDSSAAAAGLRAVASTVLAGGGIDGVGGVGDESGIDRCVNAEGTGNIESGSCTCGSGNLAAPELITAWAKVVEGNVAACCCREGCTQRLCG